MNAMIIMVDVIITVPTLTDPITVAVKLVIFY